MGKITYRRFVQIQFNLEKKIEAEIKENSEKFMLN